MKRLLRVALTLAICLCLSAAVLAVDGEITSYQAECTLDSYGAAKMTVTVALDLATPVESLPLPIGNGTGAEVAGQSTKRVKTDDGNELTIRSDAGISGQRTYVITYDIPKAVSKTETGQKLTVDLMAPGWQWPMAAASFRVTLPKAFETSPTYTGGYLSDTVEDILDLKVTDGTITGTYLEPIKDHDALRMTLELPADYFDLRSAAGISPLVALIIVAVMVLLAMFYWYKTLYNRRVSAALRPLPPDGTAAGELPLLLTGADPSLPLQIFHWAAQGYLSIHLNAKGRIVLRQNMAMGTERRRQEQVVFTSIFEREQWCDGESIRFGRLNERYANAMRQHWNRRLFSKTSGSPALLRCFSALAAAVAALGTASTGLPQGSLRWLYLTLSALAGLVGGFVVQRGCLAVPKRRVPLMAAAVVILVLFLTLAQIYGGLPAVLLALALQIFAAVSTLRGGKRSPTGRDKLAQTLGFQRFLHHVNQHQLLLLLREDSQYFYRTLPLAEALGMGQAFAAKFGEIEMEPCAYYETPKRPSRTPMGFYAEFKRSLDRMNHAGRR